MKTRSALLTRRSYLNSSRAVAGTRDSCIKWKQGKLQNSQDENLYDELVENSLIDDEVVKAQHFEEILSDREVPDVY